MKIPLLESPANISCASLHNFLSCSKSGLGIFFFPFPRDREGSGSCERKEHNSRSAGPSVSPSPEVSHACSVISQQHLEILPQGLVSTYRVSLSNKAVLTYLSSTPNSFLCKVYMMPKECFFFSIKFLLTCNVSFTLPPIFLEGNILFCVLGGGIWDICIPQKHLIGTFLINSMYMSAVEEHSIVPIH